MEMIDETEELFDENGEMTMEAKRLQLVDLCNEVLEKIEDNSNIDNEDLHFIINNVQVMKNITDTMLDIRYYIEFGDREDQQGYLFQSKWFDTEEEAREFAKQIEFCNKDCFIRLMRAEFNFDEMGDIEFVQNLK